MIKHQYFIPQEAVNIHATIVRLQSSDNGSKNQRFLFDRLIAIAKKILQRNYPHTNDIALAQTLCAIATVDRQKSQHCSKTNLLKFLANHFPDKDLTLVNAEWLAERYVRHLCTTLNYKKQDVWRSEKKQQRDQQAVTILSFDGYLSTDQKQTLLDIIPDPSIGGYDSLIADEEQRAIAEFWRYLVEDPDDRLKQCSLRNYPEVNAHVLLKLRYLRIPRMSWEAIAAHVQQPQGTITAFNSRRVLPLLEQIAQEYLVMQEIG